MDYKYVMPANKMSEDIRQNINQAVNDALKDYTENVHGGTDLDLAKWLKKWGTTATYTHMLKGLFGYLESEGLLP